MQETAYLLVSTKGTDQNKLIQKNSLLYVFSDYGMTVYFTTVVAQKIFNLQLSGVRYPFEFMNMSDLQSLKIKNKLTVSEEVIEL